MRREIAEAVCTTLYVAAGRHAGEGEFLVWADALSHLPDEGAEDIARRIVRLVDFGVQRQGPPTPALYLAAYAEQAARQRAGQTEMLPPRPGDGAEQVRRLKAMLAERPIVKRVP